MIMLTCKRQKVRKAEASSWQLTYLKSLLIEILEEESPSFVPSSDTPLSPRPLTEDNIDRILLARLSLDPSAMPEDPELITTLASLPQGETTFEYLVKCWKRCLDARYQLVNIRQKVGHHPFLSIDVD